MSQSTGYVASPSRLGNGGRLKNALGQDRPIHLFRCGPFSLNYPGVFLQNSVIETESIINDHSLPQKHRRILSFE
jgi:hypothetical protein